MVVAVAEILTARILLHLDTVSYNRSSCLVDHRGEWRNTVTVEMPLIVRVIVVTEVG